MKKVWFMLAMMVCIFESCSDGGGEEPITPTPKPEEVKTEITIDSGIISNGLSFSSAEGEQSVSFSVNADWTLSIASTTSGTTWCKASATSGSKGTANVKFTVSENTDYEDRNVSVTIKAGTVSKTFTITQKGADAMLVTTTKYEVAQEGGQIEIEVKANIDYKMEISEEAKEWIKESSSRALTTYKHKLDIAMNEDAEKREGEITFKSGDKVETVKVYQAGGAILLLSQNEYNVTDKGDTVSVDIKSNIDFGVQMSDVDWIIDEASSRGLSSHTLKYVVMANEGYDARSAEIIFYDKNSDLKDTLKVAQAQKDAILVAKNEYTIDAVGGDLKFEINSNVDFEVSASVDWIKQNTGSRGLETKPLSFTIAENPADETREGLITVSSGEIKQEIKVVQKAKPVFTLSETEFNITSEGGEFKIEVSTNGEYTITMPKVDWLKENESRATSTYTHTFTVLANETYDARETEIAFTNKETSEVVKVKVVQNQKDVIILSQKVYNVKDKGETIEVKLSVNVDFEVMIPEEVDWIIQTESRALKEHMLYFKISENNGYDNRSAKIVFAQKDSVLNDSIIINQPPMPKVVNLKEAGTLKKQLEDDYLKIVSLKVIGPINGDDIYYLRKMLGGKNFSQADWGRLSILDLSKALIVEGGEWYYEYYSDSYYASNNTIGDYMFNGCTNLQEIILPNNVTLIGRNAFKNCSSLVSINISEGIKSIGNQAFENCSLLSSIDIPNSATSIGSQAFENCSSLISVNIPNGVTSIGNQVFANCSSLISVNIPSGVTSIGNQVFANCSSLISVNIPDGVTSIGNQAFENCSSLTSVDIPDSVTSIGEYVFHNCSSLTSIVLPDGITSISNYAFFYCLSLKYIRIGKNVTSIGTSAFFGCSSMTEFYCYTSTPPKLVLYPLPFDTFQYGHTVTLYVPARCGSKYKDSSWGNNFNNIVEME